MNTVKTKIEKSNCAKKCFNRLYNFFVFLDQTEDADAIVLKSKLQSKEKFVD